MKNPKQRRLLIGLIVSACIVAGAVWLGVRQASAPGANSKDAYYNCLYAAGSDHARCMPVDDSNCYSYYHLLTNKISDGINTEAYGNTCEGAIPGDPYTFNRAGKLVR